VAALAAGLSGHFTFLPFPIAPSMTHASKVAGASLIFLAVALCPWLQQALPRLKLGGLGKQARALYLVHVPAILGADALLATWSDRIRLADRTLATIAATLLLTAVAVVAFSVVDHFARIGARRIALREWDEFSGPWTADASPAPREGTATRIKARF
jgi:hypothetical protein